MALTNEQRDQIIAAAIKDAKAGKPSLLERFGKPRAPELRDRVQADREKLASEQPHGQGVTPAVLVYGKRGSTALRPTNEPPQAPGETDDKRQARGESGKGKV